LSAGGDINAQNKNGETVLHCSVNTFPIIFSRIEFLLENGADPTIQDQSKLNVLDTLLTKSHGNYVSDLPVLIQMFAAKGCKSSHPLFTRCVSLPIKHFPNHQSGKRKKSEGKKRGDGGTDREEEFEFDPRLVALAMVVEFTDDFDSQRKVNESAIEDIVTLVQMEDN
jgi:hypothetical protein